MGRGPATSSRKAGLRSHPRTSNLGHPCTHSSTVQPTQRAALCRSCTSSRSSTHPSPQRRPSCTPSSGNRLVSTCSRPRDSHHSRNNAGCSAQECCSPRSYSPCLQKRARVCPPSKATSASIPTAAPPPPLARPGSSISADAYRHRTSGSRHPRMVRCSRSRWPPPEGQPHSSRRRSTRTRTRRLRAKTRGHRRARCTPPECSCPGAGSTRTTLRCAKTCRLRSRRQSTIRPGGRPWGSRKAPWSM
jgi:hypothetical protein